MHRNIARKWEKNPCQKPHYVIANPCTRFDRWRMCRRLHIHSKACLLLLISPLWPDYKFFDRHIVWLPELSDLWWYDEHQRSFIRMSAKSVMDAHISGHIGQSRDNPYISHVITYESVTWYRITPVWLRIKALWNLNPCKSIWTDLNPFDPDFASP